VDVNRDILTRVVSTLAWHGFLQMKNPALGRAWKWFSALTGAERRTQQWKRFALPLSSRGSSESRTGI
ncbi:hypothetical protein, partial [uncultured Serinicoccus sp.]|uniref:hypothetical protein n=1 Tax=uncultured Serinicoccus sp. TaxID=735514 RepID=UPI00262695D0